MRAARSLTRLQSFPPMCKSRGDFGVGGRNFLCSAMTWPTQFETLIAAGRSSVISSRGRALIDAGGRMKSAPNVPVFDLRRDVGEPLSDYCSIDGFSAVIPMRTIGQIRKPTVAIDSELQSFAAKTPTERGR